MLIMIIIDNSIIFIILLVGCHPTIDLPFLPLSSLFVAVGWQWWILILGFIFAINQDSELYILRYVLISILINIDIEIDSNIDIDISGR